jgi:hypothetical protein
MLGEEGSEVSRTRWLLLIAAMLVLLLGGRMVLRYLDFQASDAGPQQVNVAPE